jgi:hypothetical protein
MYPVVLITTPENWAVKVSAFLEGTLNYLRGLFTFETEHSESWLHFHREVTR